MPLVLVSPPEFTSLRSFSFSSFYLYFVENIFVNPLVHVVSTQEFPVDTTVIKTACKEGLEQIIFLCKLFDLSHQGFGRLMISQSLTIYLTVNVLCCIAVISNFPH